MVALLTISCNKMAAWIHRGRRWSYCIESVAHLQFPQIQSIRQE